MSTLPWPDDLYVRLLCPWNFQARILGGLPFPTWGSCPQPRDQNYVSGLQGNSYYCTTSYSRPRTKTLSCLSSPKTPCMDTQLSLLQLHSVVLLYLITLFSFIAVIIICFYLIFGFDLFTSLLSILFSPRVLNPVDLIELDLSYSYLLYLK